MGGTLSGWAAVITGTLDLITVQKEKENVMMKALVHGGINTTVLLGYSLLAYNAYRHYPAMSIDSPVILINKAILVSILIVGNYLGANLILKHKIAVEK
jgi:uncharacterized membrane protein